MTQALFDRALVSRRRARGIALADPRGGFLMDEIADRLVERLDPIRRDFRAALDWGGRDGRMAARLRARGIAAVTAELSEPLARRAPPPAVVADEEALPFADNSFDLIVGCLNLHWVNDLPGALVQAGRALVPDGLLLCALPGEDTLFELRASLIEAEERVLGGVAPRMSPLTQVKDLGMLLQRAGFALPVVDSDTITVDYPDPLALCRDLRAWGETNAVHRRSRRPLRRDVLAEALSVYRRRFGAADGTVPATFQILYGAGWRPDASQQQPSRRGSGTVNLAEILGKK